VSAKLTKTSAVVVTVILASLSAGCGQYIRGDRAPVILRIESLLAGEGGSPQNFNGTLRSDVRTNGSIFDDMGRVIIALLLKDPGSAGVTTGPTAMNSVTITGYRVTFRRTDGRNTPGVDVPFPFESAVTFTVLQDAASSVTFELIRHTSKAEPPLAGLVGSLVIISTIADVTFFGHDQAGNKVSVTGSIGVLFGDFADPRAA